MDINKVDLLLDKWFSVGHYQYSIPGPLYIHMYHL